MAIGVSQVFVSWLSIGARGIEVLDLEAGHKFSATFDTTLTLTLLSAHRVAILDERNALIESVKIVVNGI